jgi:hypothetical protein
MVSLYKSVSKSDVIVGAISADACAMTLELTLTRRFDKLYGWVYSCSSGMDVLCENRCGVTRKISRESKKGMVLAAT